MFFCILGYSKHIFSCHTFWVTDDFYVIFGDFFGWDWGTSTILRQNPNKITVLYGCGFGIKISTLTGNLFLRLPLQ